MGGRRTVEPDSGATYCFYMFFVKEIVSGSALKDFSITVTVPVTLA
jgi:hypothetical protein